MTGIELLVYLCVKVCLWNKRSYSHSK